MTEDLIVREATLEDRRAIWEWWNDSLTRKMMKTAGLVGWDDHCVWFDQILADNDRILCVGLVGSEKIGNVRFDLRSMDTFEVSINLNPDFRGHGYAPQMLKKSVAYLNTVRRPRKLFATLKKLNIPSEKSFDRAGFTFVIPETRYPGMEDFLPESEHYCELDLK